MKDSNWENVKLAPPDAVFGIEETFKNDKDPNKISLVVGAYRDKDGKPYIFSSVRKAEKIILAEKLNH